MTFVDTGAWLALHHKHDVDHSAATRWYREANTKLITTDFVLDELLTLCRARRSGSLGAEIVDAILHRNVAVVHWVSETDFRDALAVFKSFSDKEWSFTDCVSKVIMSKLGVKSAFAFDHHFRQFGDIEVVP